MTTWGRKVSQWMGGARLSKKASAAGKLLGNRSAATFVSFSAPRWTGRSYEQLAREGYRKNAIVNRCVRIISESAASVPFILMRGDKPLGRHPLLDLLSRPNPLQSGKELFANFYAFHELAGNAYMEVVEAADNRAGELYVLRPERMKIIPGANGWPSGFIYKVGAKSHTFRVDPKTLRSPILHLRTFHPEDDYYGLSPLESAAFGIDIHNAAANWNKALLDNAARPSGALSFSPSDGGPDNLSDEQFRRLKEELEQNYQGAVNAGRPFLLEGGLKWHAWTPATDELDIPICGQASTGKRINDQRALPAVNVGGGLVSVSTNPLSAVDAGAAARIDVAQHDRHFGFGTVTYNAGSVTSLSFSTFYYVYTDDPGLFGGSVTYMATTTKTDITDSNDRLYIGEITTPADGGGPTSGGGGGGIMD